MPQLTSNDKTILTIAGALVLLGTAGIGLLEILAGSPHPVTGEGQIVHEALVPLAIRSYIILLGFLLLAVFGVYRVLTTTPSTSGTSSF